MKKKQLLRSLCFIIILFIGLNVVGGYIQSNVKNGIDRMEENSIDYLVIGDSEAYSSISPMLMYKEKGYTGYNIGKSYQHIQNSYFNILETLKRQSPKLLFIETNFIFRDKGKADTVLGSINHTMNNYLPIIGNHNGWKQLLGEHKKTPSIIEVNHGYHYNVVKKPYTKGEYIHKTESVAPIPPSSSDYLNKVLELCAEKNIKVVFYSAPSPSNWSYDKYNAINIIANKHKLDYLDFNINKEVAFDWEMDTSDAGDHLNYNGAKKVTRYLGEYIQRNSLLSDRSKEPGLKQWNDDLEKCEKNIEKVK